MHLAHPGHRWLWEVDLWQVYCVFSVRRRSQAVWVWQTAWVTVEPPLPVGTVTLPVFATRAHATLNCSTAALHLACSTDSGQQQLQLLPWQVSTWNNFWTDLKFANSWDKTVKHEILGLCCHLFWKFEKALFDSYNAPPGCGLNRAVEMFAQSPRRSPY